MPGAVIFPLLMIGLSAHGMWMTKQTWEYGDSLWAVGFWFTYAVAGVVGAVVTTYLAIS